MGFEEFVNGASKMDTPALEKFFKTVGNILAVRKTNTLTDREAEILFRIENLVPTFVDRRYKQLQARLQKGNITEKEYADLLQITDFMEEKSVEKLHLMAELAALRKISLNELVRQIRIEKYGKAAA